MNIFMRDNEGSGFFYIESLGEGTKYIHLGYWVIVSEGAFKVSILNKYVKFRKNGDVHLE